MKRNETKRNEKRKRKNKTQKNYLPQKKELKEKNFLNHIRIRIKSIRIRIK